jgi:Pectate lyase superfamily protein
MTSRRRMGRSELLEDLGPPPRHGAELARRSFALGVAGAALASAAVPDVAWGAGGTASPALSVRSLGAQGDGRRDDTDAFQAALGQAHSSSPRRSVFVPSGTYRLTRPLVIDECTLWSDSYATCLSFSELGANTAAISLVGRSNRMDERPSLMNLHVRGPGKPHALGQSPADMDGIKIGSVDQPAQPQFQNVSVEGFRAGLVLAASNGHVFLQTVNSANNMFGMYVVDGQGDTQLVNCGFVGNSFAGIGVSPSTGLGGGFYAIMTVLGFQPYGIYQEPGETTCVFMNDVFLQARFEAIGNGAIVSKASGRGEGGKFESVHIFNAGFSWSDQYRLSAHDRDYCLQFPYADGINVIEQGAYPFIAGDRALLRCDGNGIFEIVYSGRYRPPATHVMHEGAQSVSMQSRVRTKEPRVKVVEIPAGERTASLAVQTNLWAFSSAAIAPIATPVQDPGTRWWVNSEARGSDTIVSLHLSEPAAAPIRFSVLIAV